MGSTEILVVFVKAPIPGRVKTRLAADMNVDSACAIYTRIAEHVIGAIRHGPWSMQVWVDADDRRVLGAAECLSASLTPEIAADDILLRKPRTVPAGVLFVRLGTCGIRLH